MILVEVPWLLFGAMFFTLSAGSMYTTRILHIIAITIGFFGSNCFGHVVDL
jgi:hypothetical protein